MRPACAVRVLLIISETVHVHQSSTKTAADLLAPFPSLMQLAIVKSGNVKLYCNFENHIMRKIIQNQSPNIKTKMNEIDMNTERLVAVHWGQDGIKLNW